MKEAVPNSVEQSWEFDELTKTLPPQSTAEWEAAVKAWEVDKTKENPYIVKVDSTYLLGRSLLWYLPVSVTAITQSAVRSALADEEEESIRRGDRALFHDDISPSALIDKGLELEEQQ